MRRALVRFVNWLEVELKNPNKDKQFHKSLSELVSILFAVVFGIGLAQLESVSGPYEWSVLLLAYFAVIASWWGYRYATISGYRETNVLSYCIDYFLLGVYWFLINKRGSLSLILLLYSLMFILYTLWELVRRVRIKEKSITYAVIVNTIFFSGILFLWIYNLLRPTKLENWWYILFLGILLVAYRFIIRMVYRLTNSDLLPQGEVEDTDKKLIEKAKLVATNARIHLSEFAVGAAVLTDSGKIYVGCNIEFDNYSNTIHAEEAAISAAWAAGERRILSIAVFTFSKSIHFPCGMCRQSLFELCGRDLRVIACGGNSCEIKTIGELLPFGFCL